MDLEVAHSDGFMDSTHYSVELDLSCSNSFRNSLVLNWMQIWLKMHCASGWKLVFHEAKTSKDRTLMIVEFQDGNDAMIFKLSPEFSSCQGKNFPKNVHFFEIAHTFH